MYQNFNPLTPLISIENPKLNFDISQLPLIIPITFTIISAFLMVVPCYVAPYEVLMGVLITVAGIPVYYFGVVWKNKPKFVQNGIGKLNDLNIIKIT